MRVTTDGNVIITDPNDPVVDSATLFWGPTPGDRSNQFTLAPVVDTTLNAIGITVPGQYHMVAVGNSGGVDADESNEVPFDLTPMALVLAVQP